MQTGSFMTARLVRLGKRAMPDSKPLPYTKPPPSLLPRGRKRSWSWNANKTLIVTSFKMTKRKSSVATEALVPVELIERQIYFVRGHKVMLDSELA
jgi:hypothetical protein